MTVTGGTRAIQRTLNHRRHAEVHIASQKRRNPVRQGVHLVTVTVRSLRAVSSRALASNSRSTGSSTNARP